MPELVTRIVVLEITYNPALHDHPRDWDWAALIDAPREDVKVIASDEARR